MEKSGVTRKELADRLGMHYGGFCQILAGTRPLSPKLADRLAAIMFHEPSDEGRQADLMEIWEALCRLKAECSRIEELLLKIQKRD